MRQPSGIGPRCAGAALAAGAVLGALLSGGALLAGCDQHPAGESGGVVAFDLAPLFQTANGEPCVSVVETLQLTVTEPDGTEQVVVRELAADDAEVRIPVTVAAGRVRFEAAVRSNNGTLLYSGARVAEVGGSGFRVEVPVGAVNAVLRACPAPAPLVPVSRGLEGEFYLHNRGTRTVAWTVSPCDARPFFLEICEGEVEPGSHDLVYAIALFTSPPFAVDVRVTSEVGTLDVRFTTAAPPPAPLLAPREAAAGSLADGLRQRLLSLPSLAPTPWTPSP